MSDTLFTTPDITRDDCERVVRAYMTDPGPLPLVLRAFAGLVAASVLSQGLRNEAVAELRLVASLPSVQGLTIRAVELRDAYLALAAAASSDSSAIVGRRQLLRDLADLFPGILSMRDECPAAVAVWRAVAESRGSVASLIAQLGPHAAALAELSQTYAREADELPRRSPRRRSDLPTLDDFLGQAPTLAGSRRS